ncbi:MAG TPA: FAD-dependent thymidylate synthase [Bacilli bacterium]|nr:FAD-dependent thymidylate synthase [Bacilli bacterium]
MKVVIIGMTMPVIYDEIEDIIEADLSMDITDLVAGAANVCYNPIEIGQIFENLTSEKRAKLIDRTLNDRHMSIYEHVSFNFAISGVSRALLAQLTRHRIASFSVQSQRYCKLSEPDYITPDSIMNHPEALSEYDGLMELIWETYNQLVDSGIPKEDARMVLPNACTTQLIMTMNIRELFHFFKLRMCKHAQWEIQELATRIFEQVEITAPHIFSYVNKQCEHEKCYNACGGCVIRQYV